MVAASANDLEIRLRVSSQVRIPQHQLGIAENGVHRGADLVRHGRKKRTLGPVGRLRVRLGLQQLRVGGLQLLRVAENLGFHLLHKRERLDALGLRLLPNELRHVLNAMDQIHDPAVRPQHGGVDRAPVTFLEDAVRPPYVVFLDGHGVWSDGLEHPVEGRAQFRDTRCRKVLGIIGENLEDTPAEQVLPLSHRCLKICVAH